MADAAGEEVDNEINLEQLKLLKEIFEVWAACVLVGKSTSKSTHSGPWCPPLGSDPLLLARCSTPCLLFATYLLLLLPYTTAPSPPPLPPLCPTQAADEDGSGELDVEEFCAKLGPHLGVNLKPQQVAQLFMKIDADAGGTVDWWVTV